MACPNQKLTIIVRLYTHIVVLLRNPYRFHIKLSSENTVWCGTRDRTQDILLYLASWKLELEESGFTLF